MARVRKVPLRKAGWSDSARIASLKARQALWGMDKWKEQTYKPPQRDPTHQTGAWRPKGFVEALDHIERKGEREVLDYVDSVEAAVTTAIRYFESDPGIRGLLGNLRLADLKDLANNWVMMQRPDLFRKSLSASAMAGVQTRESLEGVEKRMPLPTPAKTDDESSFMSRCMSDEHMKSKFPDSKQRVAVCMSQYKSVEKSVKAEGPLLVLPLRKGWSEEARQAAVEARRKKTAKSEEK